MEFGANADRTSQGARPVALLTGDFEAAERSVTMLLDHAERAGLN
jgi:hypothetical protein